jgi:CRP/FNR family cyclic AMP-dependent transcriptional regulator
MLADDERTALFSVGGHARFVDDEILMLQGDTGDFLYVLTNGFVKIVAAAESGVETTLAFRSRGDVVGEFALLDDKPRVATARAVGVVTAVRVSRAAFLALTGQSQAFQEALTKYLLHKIRASTERRVAERIWDARERIAQVLHELAEMRSEPDEDGIIRVPITQSELGDLAGVAVSTTERVLAEFRKRGVISTRYREIAVRNLAFLAEIRFS